MPPDPSLLARLRAELETYPNVAEKKMFGGVVFIVNGHLALGIHGDEVIVRTTPEVASEALKQAHVRVFDLGAWPLKGWLLVRAQACTSTQALRRWMQTSLKFAGSLPAKSK